MLFETSPTGSIHLKNRRVILAAERVGDEQPLNAPDASTFCTSGADGDSGNRTRAAKP